MRLERSLSHLRYLRDKVPIVNAQGLPKPMFKKTKNNITNHESGELRPMRDSVN